MDRLIARFDSLEDGDLRLCPHRGVAYQADMRVTMRYDQAYFEKFANYDGAVACRINQGRIDFVNRHFKGRAIDIGVGCGQFVAGRPDTYGYDVNPHAEKWLKENERWASDLQKFEAFTFWDVLEHVENPEQYFKNVRPYGWVFVSLPIFESLDTIRSSKHYKPGEHLYYFTDAGFVEWMKLWGFTLVSRSDHETMAGRESIGSYAFVRTGAQYRDMLGQYVELHHTRHYGASARAYLKPVSDAVRQLRPSSILDFGCGRSDLVAHFWADGARRLGRYDPAIPEFKEMPPGPWDVVLCCDVMEHIRMADVERIFTEIRKQSRRVVFVISTKPARALLPNGMNAHVTLLTDSEWMRWIADVFGKCERVPYEPAHLLMLKTF